MQAGTHPDFRLCEPEIDEKKEREKLAIGIDQVREVADFVSFKAHHDGYKVVVVRPADRLNTFAANSLLKTLEEPPGASLLILSTARPGALPATIRTDGGKLEQVVNNLLSNAFKFTASGSVEVTIGRPAQGDDVPAALDRTRAIAIAVMDSGIGIPPSKFLSTV